MGSSEQGDGLSCIALSTVAKSFIAALEKGEVSKDRGSYIQPDRMLKSIAWGRRLTRTAGHRYLTRFLLKS